MCNDMQADMVVEHSCHLYHKSVVKHPGGYTVGDRTIKPMGTALAAIIAETDETTFKKRLDPNQEPEPFLKHWMRNLLGGMDTASLDNLEHELGRLVFNKPKDLPRPEAINREAVKLGKEFGDVMSVIAKATDPDSPNGTDLSRNEREDAAQQLYELLERGCVMLKGIEGE